MGRAPCCDKANVKKGPWSAEEDANLKSHIEKHGTGSNWIALPQKIGLNRCGKSCRLRWLNYLRPNIKHGGFSEEEDNLICSLYISIGSRWSIIAAQLPGRTDNDIKNYWNTKLKKKLLGYQRKARINKRRRGDILKREMEKGIVRGSKDLSMDNISVANYDISNQMLPYCPTMPSSMPTLLQQPSHYNNHVPVLDPMSFGDHNSIRKLLIKLGGRFCGNVSFSGNTQYDQPVSLNCVQRDSTSFQVLESCKEGDVRFLPMLQPQRSDSYVGLGFSTNAEYPQEGLEGLGFLSGDDSIMGNDARLLSGNNESCGPVVGWGEMSNFIHSGNLMQEIGL